MSKLIPLSERVDQLKSTPSEFIRGILKLDAFLKTNLLSNYTVDGKEYHYLNRFVPATIDGEIISKPIFDELLRMNEMDDIYEEYQDHLSKVMFEGFDVRIQSTYHVVSKGDSIVWVSWNKSKTISTILVMLKDATLTPFGAKTAGL